MTRSGGVRIDRMARTLRRSLAVGIAAAGLWFVAGLTVDGILIHRSRPAATPPAQATAPVAPSADAGDDVTVTTIDEVVQVQTWNAPYLASSSLAILLIASIWAHRRFRAPDTRA